MWLTFRSSPTVAGDLTVPDTRQSIHMAPEKLEQPPGRRKLHVRRSGRRSGRRKRWCRRCREQASVVPVPLPAVRPDGLYQVAGPSTRHRPRCRNGPAAAPMPARDPERPCSPVARLGRDRRVVAIPGTERRRRHRGGRPAGRSGTRPQPPLADRDPGRRLVAGPERGADLPYGLGRRSALHDCP